MRSSPRGTTSSRRLELSELLKVIKADLRRIVTDADVLQAERSLYRVRHDAMAKRDELDRLARAAPDQGSSGWMSRVFGTKAQQGGSASPSCLVTRQS